MTTNGISVPVGRQIKFGFYESDVPLWVEMCQISKSNFGSGRIPNGILVLWVRCSTLGKNVSDVVRFEHLFMVFG